MANAWVALRYDDRVGPNSDLERIQEQVPPDVAEAARSLDKHYAPRRYPDALGEADRWYTEIRKESRPKIIAERVSWRSGGSMYEFYFFGSTD